MSDLPEMTKDQAARKYFHMRIMAYIGVATVTAIGIVLLPIMLIMGLKLSDDVTNILELVVTFWGFLVIGGYYGMTNIRDAFGKS